MRAARFQESAPDLGPEYRVVKALGRGFFGSVYHAQHISSGQDVAIKLIQRGEAVARGSQAGGGGEEGRPSMVERELINHRRVSGHPNIIRFYEVYLTPTHLCIVMEYAAGGELFSPVRHYKGFSEQEARHCFQQLICGVAWCHRQHVCHRDLKLENSLLADDLSVRICDFGYSKSGDSDSNPKSAVGTPAYVAPEVLGSMHNPSAYDGAMADIWSCGVILYTMLVGSYPFHDPADPGNHAKAIENIRRAHFTFPPQLNLQDGARDLIRRMLMLDPRQRIRLPQVMQHPWFRQDLGLGLQDGGVALALQAEQPRQSEEEIRALVQEAKSLPEALQPRLFNEYEFLSSGDSLMRNIEISFD